MNENDLARRRFLVAAIALSGAAALSLHPGLIPLSRAWAEAGDGLGAAERQALVRMARLLFPHDDLPDDVYARVLDQAMSDVAGGQVYLQYLESAAAALTERTGGAWAQLDAADQVAAMRSMEAEPWFVAIQNSVRAGVYFSPEFWAQVGYPGPSSGFGGYRYRGAGEIDWLPEESA